MDPTAKGPGSASERFEALVMPHIDALLSFARYRVASSADAEDLVQEVCVRAWSDFDGLRDEERARAWVFRILRRQLSDHHRTRTRRNGRAEVTRLSAEQEQAIASEVPGPLESLLARLSTEWVRAALATIPQDFAMAVALHDVADFQYREIAEILEVPLGTVMSRIYRGRKLLAERLAAEETFSIAPVAEPGMHERGPA